MVSLNTFLHLTGCQATEHLLAALPGTEKRGFKETHLTCNIINVEIVEVKIIFVSLLLSYLYIIVCSSDFVNIFVCNVFVCVCVWARARAAVWLQGSLKEYLDLRQWWYIKDIWTDYVDRWFMQICSRKIWRDHLSGLGVVVSLY
jgi:hypothetical protein